MRQAPFRRPLPSMVSFILRSLLGIALPLPPLHSISLWSHSRSEVPTRYAVSSYARSPHLIVECSADLPSASSSFPFSLERSIWTLWARSNFVYLFDPSSSLRGLLCLWLAVLFIAKLMPDCRIYSNVGLWFLRFCPLCAIWILSSWWMFLYVNSACEGQGRFLNVLVTEISKKIPPSSDAFDSLFFCPQELIFDR